MTTPRNVSVVAREGKEFTIEHLWLGIPVFVLLSKSFIFPLPTLDFWWHLKMGEVIATTGSIPRVDLFSFTAAGEAFIAQNWLAELIFFGAYRLGGLPLLVFFGALVLVGALLPVYALCREATGSARTAALAGMIAAIAYIPNVRPQIFSFLMFSIFYWILAGYRSRRRRMLWMLPLLMVLWVNLHGAFVMGLGLLSLYLGCEVFRHWMDPARTDALTRAELSRLLGVFVLCALATLANPEGFAVYDYVRVVMADGGSQDFVAEWQPPRIDDISGVVLFYGPFFVTMLVLMYARSKPDLTELALFLAFAVLALKSVRNGVWFVMIACPILARHASLIKWSLPRRLAFANLTAEGRPANRRMNVLIAFLAIAALALLSPWVQPRLYKTSLIDSHTPVAAADFIAERKLKGNIFHPQIFGDYLIWRLWPEQKSFIDGRVHLFGLDFVRQYRLVFHDSGWEHLMAGWSIRYLLLSKGSGQDDSLTLIGKARASNGWTLLYEDDVAVLFEKLPRS